MLTIEGSDGAGGGQMLRLALALAMATGTAFRIDNIRAGRPKPGLLRQHISCIHAARDIADARLLGDHLGSQSLVFEPRAIKGGSSEHAIGAAATTHVLLTLLPALLLATSPSRLVLSGGTHVPSAPTTDYLDEILLPLLRRMGVEIELKTIRAGFHPAAGGKVMMRVTPPRRLLPLSIEADEPTTVRRVRAVVANLPFEIAKREVAHALHLLSWPAEVGAAHGLEADGPGNVVAVTVGTSAAAEMFTGFGALGITGEAMVERTVASVRDHLVTRAPVGPHLAEHLLVPMAMAGSGSFVTVEPTAHTRAAIALIEKFLPVEIDAAPLGDRRWQVTIAS